MLRCDPAKRSLSVASLSIAITAKSDFIPAGTALFINDPTNLVAFGTDTTASLDQLMDDIREKDQDAIKDLLSEGHLIPAKNGTKGRTIEFDPSENAYKVRVTGTNHPVWFIKEIVSEAN